jgi:LPXTG-site transpeptidase (sortase) family protein
MRGFRYGLAVIIVVVTGYVGFDIWQTNTALKQDLSKTVSQLGSPNAEAHQDNEGRDETPVLKDAVDSYRVAPSLPRVVTIDKVKVRARVVSMDVNPDNSIQAPINIYDAGWYTGSAKPGEPGAALIDGHASGATRQGLFAYLDTLTVGDVIKVERGDGTRFVYEVVYAEIVNKDEVDMTALLKPYDGVAQGLNLITCTGKYIKDQKTYDHRAIVYTKLVRQELP